MTLSLPRPQLLKNFWAKNENSIWLNSCLRLYRNLKTHQFPHKLSEAFLTDLTQMLTHPLKKCPEFKKGSFYSFSELSPEDKQLLIEYYLPRKSFLAFHHGEGIYIDPTHRLYALLNTSDHLIFHLFDPTNHLEQAWNNLATLENELGQEIEFAFSNKFGFLTSSSYSCGTGLHVDLMLHLPALNRMGLCEKVFESISPSQAKISSLSGQKNHFLGDIFVLSSLQTIGISEEHTLKTMHNYVLQLILAEKKARADNKQKLHNLVAKAYGTLKHAYQLDIEEALNNLSLCKLGVEIGSINNLKLIKVNELLFTMQQQLLKSQHSEHAHVEKQRAVLIQDKLNKSSLN